MLANSKLAFTPTEQSNVRHLVLDIAWFGLAAAATTHFLSEKRRKTPAFRHGDIRRGTFHFSAKLALHNFVL